MAAHAVAIGLREFVSVDDGIAEAMRSAAEAGAAIVAAHPNADEPALAARTPDEALLARRGAARARPPVRALQPRAALRLGRRRRACPRSRRGDFHVPEHLHGWKTLLPSRHDEGAVVDYLRSPRPVYLTRLDDELARAAA